MLKEYFHPLSTSYNVSLARDNYLKYIAKAYTDDDLAEKVGVTRQQADAMVYCQSACRAYMADQIDTAKGDLVKSIQLDPQLSAGSYEQVAKIVLSWAWRPLTTDPVKYIETVFKHLPGECERLNKWERHCMARAWMAVAFRSFQRKAYAQVHGAVLRTISYDPSLALNRGLLAVSAKAFLNRLRNP